MNIAIVGTGYVGLVSGTCFADIGANVTCVDIDKTKVDNLRRGIVPIYEPGLEDMVELNIRAGRLRFHTALEDNIDSYDAIICAVGTPSGEDGSADLKYVMDVARTVGRCINSYTLFVTKSTVPVGTGQLLRAAIREELDKRGVDVEFDIASNPEFLKEGAAINDFMHPDRVVIGVDTERARNILEHLYTPLTGSVSLLFTDIASAEMIKYASNAMLATRISFMNDIANLCGLLGADVEMVRQGVGADTRIGSKFLNPGIGYGGSCFPKDIKALINIAFGKGYDMQVLRAVESVNERQKRLLFEMFNTHFDGHISGRTVALWGLSFKPETDDMREAPSIVIIRNLIKSGCRVNVYDSVASEEARIIFGDSINYFSDKYAALEKADCLMLVTEWKEFRIPDWNVVKERLLTPLILDGRNMYNPTELRAKGFTYLSIGNR